MNECFFPLRSGGGMIFRAGSVETVGWLAALSKLTGCSQSPTGKEQNPSCTITVGSQPFNQKFQKLFNFKTHRLCLDKETKAFQVQVRPSELENWRSSSRAQSYTGYLAVIGAALQEILRGKPVMLMHGALLASPKGTFLFCGQSGIGKSTTSRRWQAVGGEVLSDDMALLEFCEDGVWAHPLPTWSRCAEGMAGLHYAFHPPRKLTHLFALSRAQTEEEVRIVERWQFQQVLYDASMLFCREVLKYLPEEIQSQLVKTLQTRCDELAEQYVPKALLAHLDGDLKTTLKEYL